MGSVFVILMYLEKITQVERKLYNDHNTDFKITCRVFYTNETVKCMVFTLGFTTTTKPRFIKES